MNEEKLYKGEKYSFYRGKKPLGKGGNGAVYSIRVVGKESIPLVAKFFYCTRDIKRRYERFKREATFLASMPNVKGIMPVLDLNCPESFSGEQEAWYIMPKAEKYNINSDIDVGIKIEDMLCLAKTVKSLHEKNIAHRDIKPENILLLNNEIVLSDFGLVWEYDEERLTTKGDRIGPYKILPPELESFSGEEKTDFRSADVYLFAKVVWMTVKGDNIGFRGQYNRGDSQIYLDKDNYNITTFEPLHKLLENATIEDSTARISINDCIYLLELQKQIINNDLSDETLLASLKYDEISKAFIARTHPSEYIFEDRDSIMKLVQSLIPNSNIFIKLEEGGEVQLRISYSDFERNDILKLFSIFGNRITDQYSLKIGTMRYSIKNDEAEISIFNLDETEIEPGSIPYGKRPQMKGIGPMKYYLTPAEHLIIRKA